ncbi:PTS sugar transporter subunit IIA [Desulfococcus sp.]|uniref:PTS sugar transporter subunit IIA n=1 Tax=Desulfococcus sp. TaxID=2025834 RepID=UPI0035933D21
MKLTINDVARSLDLPLSTVERWIRQGRIPMVRSGHTCSFDRSALEKWAKAHNLVFSDQDVFSERDSGSSESPENETLLSAMKAGGVLYGVRGGTAEDVLTSAVDAMAGFSPEERAKILERLLDRERLTSTGIGKGIAIPHPRTPFCREGSRSVVVTCFLDAPIPYRAVDNRPVFVLFVLLSPTSRQHLQILSRLSFCVRDDAFVAFLKGAPETYALLARIDAFERTLDQKGLV